MAGNAAINSNEDDVSVAFEEPTPPSRRKKRRGPIGMPPFPKQVAALALEATVAALAGQERPSQGEAYPPEHLTWVPGHYMPWSSPTTMEETCAQTKRRPVYGDVKRGPPVGGKKATRVEVLDNGDIDATSEGKNAWDEAIRFYVPKILNMSVVEWSLQKPITTHKLRELLDAEFEYVGNPLSTIGFCTIITR